MDENKQAEPVAFALKFKGDGHRLCLSTIFDTMEEAQNYSESCKEKPDVVALYTHPAPAVAQPPADVVREALQAAKQQMVYHCWHESKNSSVRKAYDMVNRALTAYPDHVNETPKNEHDSDDVLTKARNVNHIGDANKMVRLTDEEIDTHFERECWVSVTFSDGAKGIALDKVTARDFAHSLQDAWIKKNGG